MGEKIDFENGPKWSNFRLSWAPDLDLDLGSGHGHYLFLSLIEYYLYTKFHRNRRNFLWTDVRTDGKLPPIVLGRLPKFGSRPKNVCLNGLQWKNKLDLIWSSIRPTLSNCSDNVKNTIQETNWDSCPIQAELMSMKQTLRNSQYSIEGHRIFSPPP